MESAGRAHRPRWRERRLITLERVRILQKAPPIMRAWSQATASSRPPEHDWGQVHPLALFASARWALLLCLLLTAHSTTGGHCLKIVRLPRRALVALMPPKTPSASHYGRFVARVTIIPRAVTFTNG